MKFIEKLEYELGVKAIKKMKPMQQGDVKGTESDCSLLNKWINKNYVKKQIKFYGNCSYSNYLKRIIKSSV